MKITAVLLFTSLLCRRAADDHRTRSRAARRKAAPFTLTIVGTDLGEGPAFSLLFLPLSLRSSPEKPGMENRYATFLVEPTASGTSASTRSASKAPTASRTSCCSGRRIS